MPDRFLNYEAWLAREKRETSPAVPRNGCCAACGREGNPSGTGRCESCDRYAFGHDQGEATTAFGIIRGAVRTALEVGVPKETVMSAVMDALDADSEWEAPHLYSNHEIAAQQAQLGVAEVGGKLVRIEAAA